MIWAKRNKKEMEEKFCPNRFHLITRKFFTWAYEKGLFLLTQFCFFLFFSFEYQLYAFPSGFNFQLPNSTCFHADTRGSKGWNNSICKMTRSTTVNPRAFFEQRILQELDIQGSIAQAPWPVQPRPVHLPVFFRLGCREDQTSQLKTKIPSYLHNLCIHITTFSIPNITRKKKPIDIAIANSLLTQNKNLLETLESKRRVEISTSWRMEQNHVLPCFADRIKKECGNHGIVATQNRTVVQRRTLALPQLLRYRCNRKRPISRPQEKETIPPPPHGPPPPPTPLLLSPVSSKQTT